MPPSWSTRLLSSNARTLSQYPSSSDRDHHPPQRPPPPRPSTSEPARHAHNRSVSHPLPRLFGRKKSAGALNSGVDIPLDESLVPVLSGGDAVVVGHKGSGIAKRPGLGSGRISSGVGGDVGGEEGDGKVVRRCVCCDSRVRVPREVERFRCMCCLTVCDLRGRGREERLGDGLGRREVVGVERTREIVERCLIGYLEGRCRRVGVGQRLEGSGKQAQHANGEDSMAGRALPASTSTRGNRASQQLSDPPVSTSPPDTPNSSEFPSLAHSATIKDFSDFDLFASTRTNTPPPTAKPVPTCAGPLRQPSISRNPLPTPPGRKPPPPPVSVAHRTPSQGLRPNAAHPAAPGGGRPPRIQHNPPPISSEAEARVRYDRVKTIFRPLEDYMLATFGDYDCLNTSFSTVRPHTTGRTKSESNIVTPPREPAADRFSPSPTNMFDELDPKTLLLGDIGENGSWWAGRLDRNRSDRAFQRKRVAAGSGKPVSSKSPNIDWGVLREWYDIVHSAGEDWHQRAAFLTLDPESYDRSRLEGLGNVEEIDEELAEAREHAIRALLKITENVLKRPTKPLKEPEDLRFLLVLLQNPSLYPSRTPSTPRRAASTTARNVNRAGSGRLGALQAGGSLKNVSPQKSPGRDAANHTGIVKRALGLMANSSESCHRYLITWFSRFDEAHFTALVDLVGSFVTHRIARRASKPRRKSHATDGGLIPDLSGGAMNTSVQLHAAMGLSGSVKKRSDEPGHETEWAEDWQAKVAAKVMSLLFAANNVWQGSRARDPEGRGHIYPASAGLTELSPHSTAVRPQDKARRTGQLLHTSSFYNTLLDYHDLIADFKVWESKRDKFSFCQYPLFLSMGAKIKILEYDARRQMEIKAREAYFDQVIRQRAIDGYFHLRVRRDCMVDDSLKQISAAVGAGQEELKKGLRVHFAGEEGVDAGGPRKEWFLMLVREVFDAEHGLFVYDDDSRTCYFNPSTFETSDQYYLVGALLGLAIYNSTILDIVLPPFAFRKLLAAAPAPASTSAARDNISSLTGTKGQMTYTLVDLAEFRPQLAAGLQQLLDFDGDVEATYCWTFVAPLERYGAVTEVPLLSNGENTPVTNANRAQFVDLYVRYLLDGAVARQFEPFKRGFFTVCAGNALSLFRAEEIELLVRGSDELLDVDSLRAVAVYENWKSSTSPHLLVPNPAEQVPQIGWFWDVFAAAPITTQRKLLSFITGSDRIPAVGSTSLVLRIVRGGEGWGHEGEERFPVARTCFNMLVLWGYGSKEVLEEKLWRAVGDSEGFGLK